MRSPIHSSRSLFSVFTVFLSLSFFASTASAADLTLAWDANLETDLAGYRVYYKTGGSGAPYDGIDLDQGDSGIDLPLENLTNPAAPQITLTGLAEDTAYFLAVTAYNQQGSESGFSNEVTYRAASTVTTHTLTATATAGGSISPAGTNTVAEGSDQTYSITPADGYHIASIQVDGASVALENAYTVNQTDGSASTGTAIYTFSNITADHTIAAVFDKDAVNHTITATASIGGSISPAGTNTVAEGSDQTYSITPADGYHIASVQVDGASVALENAYAVSQTDGSASTGTATYTFSNITADHTIAASFTLDTHTITAASGDNGSISPSGTVVLEHGADRSFSITPDSGFHVSDVLVDGNSVGAVASYTFDNVTTGHIITAVFEKTAVNHTITATAGAGGSISPQGPTTVADGNDQKFTIIPDAGYRVADVRVDGTSIGAKTAYTFSAVAADHKIEASFAADTFTITASAGENGSITPEGQIVVQSGEDQTITFIPADGCAITDVQVDGASVGIAGQYTFTDVTENHTIAVSFAAPSPPTADAGPDQTVDEGVTVTLSGANSTDPDDGIESFQWEQVSGPAVALVATGDEAEVNFLTPDVDQNGATLVFQLTVTDYSGVAVSDTCIINVTWVNIPPVANAGTDLNVTEGDNVALDASLSSDADDGIATYQWTQTNGIEVQLSDPIVAAPSFSTPNIGPDGAALTFELTVTDRGGLKAQDTCIVNVCWENEPPTADAGSDQSADEGSLVSLDGSKSSDPDDGIALYQWKQTSGTPVTLSDATAIQPGFSAPTGESEADTLDFTLTVTDKGGLQHSDTCRVTLAPGIYDTVPPTVEISSPRIRWYYYFSRYNRIDIAGTADDDTGVSRVTWKNSTGGSGTAAGTTRWRAASIPLERGVNVVTITAEDAAGNQTSQSISIYRYR